MIEERTRKVFECQCDNCGRVLGRGDTAHEAQERAKDACAIARWYGMDNWVSLIYCLDCLSEAKKVQSYDPEHRELLVYGKEGADHEK